MMLARRGLWIACGVLLASASALAAPPEPGAGTPAPATAAEPADEKPIPVAEVAIRAERAVLWLRSLVPALEAQAKLDRATSELERVASRVWDGLTDTRELLEQGPRVSVVDSAEASWREGRQEISALSDALTAAAEETEKTLDRVRDSRERWRRTADAAHEAEAPETVVTRIGDTQREIDLTREQILRLRERILSLQDKAARLVAVADEVQATLAAYRSGAVERLGAPSGRPLWHERVINADPMAAARRIDTAAELELARARQFAELRAEVLRFQLVVFVLLAGLFRTARSRARLRAKSDPSVLEDLVVLDTPYSAAIVITLLSSLWLHPELPVMVASAAVLALLVPLLRILRRLVPAPLVWLPYTVSGFVVFDRVRDVVAAAPLLEQVALVIEMSAALGLAFWVLRFGRLRARGELAQWARELRLLRVGAAALACIFATALGAAVFGYVQVARFLATTSLGAVYAGMALYAAARTARGLAGFLLGVRPLSKLRVVQRHREIVEQRVQRGLGWLAAATWLFAMLRTFGGADTTSGVLQQVLDTSVSFGTLTLSAGNVLAFAVTVWASFLISRFVRFVLGEEIYPRLALPHGAPYAISSLVHYTILLAGFFLALAGMGLDLNKVTVLGGALGVGIGFGLQTIVNNFVSGLILLFERPVQIGDTVQVADVSGEVRRIGIRSSTIRTTSGAEVIVPNSDLISQRVTNWTLSDRSRRFEIPVGVAYGTRPAEVLALLAEVATKHPEVLDHPGPMPLFVRFGDSAIEFELRAWVVDGDRLPIVKTEVAVALSLALEAAGIEIPFPQREVTVRGEAKG